MDSLTGLRVFVKVVETGSFTAAAEALELSRAMVSKHVQTLEARLGVRLLQRSTRRVALTEAGSRYHARASVWLEDMDATEAELTLQTAEARGTLRVSAPMSFGRVHVAPLLAEFLQQHPQVRVDLALADRAVDLIEDGYDLAVRIGELADSSLVCRRLATTRLLLCAAPAYLAAHGTPQQVEDLAAHECLSYRLSDTPADWHFTDPDGRSRSVRIDGRMRADNGEALCEAAACGLGIVLQPDFIVGPYLQDGRLLPLLLDWNTREIGIHAVYPERRYLPARARRFIDFLAGRYALAPWRLGS